jgi:hypothetical protein
MAYQMQSRFGIALLHKHNKCARGEYMIEYKDVFRGQDVLITRPVARTAAQENATPTVWSLAERRLLPLEFTKDPVASDLLEDGDVPEDFLDDFADLANSAPIGKFLGLAVVERAFYRAAKPNEIALEYSNLLERSNVVFLSDRSEGEGKSIETAWRFNTYPDAMTRCVDTRQCIRRCHFKDSQGGHTGAQVHVPGPGEHLPGSL